jgi:hypothetical protein
MWAFSHFPLTPRQARLRLWPALRSLPIVQTYSRSHNSGIFSMWVAINRGIGSDLAFMLHGQSLMPEAHRRKVV